MFRFENEEARERSEALAAETAEMLDSMDHPVKAQKTLAICILINLCLFGIIFFLPQAISEFPFETQIFISMVLFTLGFFTGYALIKLYDFFYARKGKELKSIDPGIMSGFQYTDQQN